MLLQADGQHVNTNLLPRYTGQVLHLTASLWDMPLSSGPKYYSGATGRDHPSKLPRADMIESQVNNMFGDHGFASWRNMQYLLPGATTTMEAEPHVAEPV